MSIDIRKLQPGQPVRLGGGLKKQRQRSPLLARARFDQNGAGIQRITRTSVSSILNTLMPPNDKRIGAVEWHFDAITSHAR